MYTVVMLLLFMFVHANEVCDKVHPKICSALAQEHYIRGEIIEAVKLLQIPCSQGIGATCGLIGACYRDGKGDLKKNLAKAEYYLAKACENNYTKVCRDLGILYQQQKKVTKAVKVYQKGCDKKGVGSCYNLGTMYFQGDGIKKSLSKAKKYYQKSCEYGSKNGCIRFKKLMETKSTSSTGDDKPFKKLIEKCQAKDAEACHNLSALYYQSGNYEKALQFDEKACIYKYAMGCKNVALSYYNGDHIPKDIHEALSFFKIAGSLGDGGSFYNAALIYEKGDGVTKDMKEAKDFFIRACMKKDMPSCNKLGRYFEEGIGVKKDTSKAKWFYKTSCDNNYAKGCANMAFIYLQGIGVDKDPLQAKTFFEKACSLGDKQSCKNSKSIKVEKSK